MLDHSITVTGHNGTTVNGSSAWSSFNPVAFLNVNFKNSTGNDVVLLDSVAATTVLVPKVEIDVGTQANEVEIGETLGIDASSVLITSKDSANVAGVTVIGSTIGSLTLNLGNASGDLAELSGNTLGTANVYEGSGAFDAINSTGNSYINASFTQGNGFGDFIFSLDDAVSETTGASAIIVQGDGSGDVVIVEGLNAFVVTDNAKLLSITQGSGNLDTVTLTVGDSAENVTITQGDGSADLVTVDDTAVYTAVGSGVVNDLNITQGNGGELGDMVEVADLSSVFVAGNLTITQTAPITTSTSVLRQERPRRPIRTLIPIPPPSPSAVRSPSSPV